VPPEVCSLNYPVHWRNWGGEAARGLIPHPKCVVVQTLMQKYIFLAKL